MNIGQYTFEEFKEIARQFHGYPAPGLLIGGYMVELAKSHMPEGTLFEVIVESNKCLPDAVQLLTLCSTGNNWMRVVNLGRYALSMFDKYTGEGVRVYIDTEKIEQWPDIADWFLKRVAKADQDTDLLFAKIKEAGAAYTSVERVTIPERFLGHKQMRAIGVCPACGEAFPTNDGPICRGCQGEAPYVTMDQRSAPLVSPNIEAVPVEEAVGKAALHDMTRIVPGESKGPEFRAGHELSVGDVCRLHQMGRSNVYTDDVDPGEDWLHENKAVEGFAKRMAGDGIAFEEQPSEGKIDFTADRDGLFVVDREKLEAFNLVPDVMCATRQGESLVEAGKRIAGTRAIPLFISRENYSKAVTMLEGGPLFEVKPLRKAKTGVLVTGTEVFQGLIEDKFIPIISGKVAGLGGEITATDIVPDDREAIAGAVRRMIDAGCDLIVTTAGLSVDPDDVTRHALNDAGLTDVVYGAPVLPGAMTLVGRIGGVQVLGVPACALFFKTTSLDLMLPRLMAGQTVTRRDMARLAEGGYCLGCRTCTFPKCPFGK
ncbi:FmdE family protein [Salidesulfovibrio brasiliensis]